MVEQELQTHYLVNYYPGYAKLLHEDMKMLDH